MNEKSEFFAVVTNEQKTLLNIRNEYKNALNMMKNKFLYLEESVITSGVSVKECVEVENISEYMDKVVSYVEVQDNEKIEEIINLFKTYILQNKYSEERVKSICMNTLLNIRLKLFKDYEIDKNDISGNEDIIHNIYSKKSLKELLNYMNDELISMSKKVYVGSADNNIKRIISYMEKNYYNDIKLETLAEIFNYNSAYLGKLLKNALGENFNTKSVSLSNDFISPVPSQCNINICSINILSSYNVLSTHLQRVTKRPSLCSQRTLYSFRRANF